MSAFSVSVAENSLQISKPRFPPSGFDEHLPIGVDSKEGVVHSVCSTAASVSDIHMLPELLHDDEKKMWGDAGYQGKPRPSMRLRRKLRT